jgi:hypothetical protein
LGELMGCCDCTQASAELALASAVMAGSMQLTVNLMDAQRAASSTGGMVRIRQQASQALLDRQFPKAPARSPVAQWRAEMRDFKVQRKGGTRCRAPSLYACLGSGQELWRRWSAEGGGVVSACGHPHACVAEQHTVCGCDRHVSQGPT